MITSAQLKSVIKQLNDGLISETELVFVIAASVQTEMDNLYQYNKLANQTHLINANADDFNANIANKKFCAWLNKDSTIPFLAEMREALEK